MASHCSSSSRCVTIHPTVDVSLRYLTSGHLKQRVNSCRSARFVNPRVSDVSHQHHVQWAGYAHSLSDGHWRFALFVGGFTSWQRLRSYQDGCRSLTVHTHGDFIGDQATCIMTQFLTQSHYLGTELTSPCPVLVMPSTRLGIDKYQTFSDGLFSRTVLKSVFRE